MTNIEMAEKKLLKTNKLRNLRLSLRYRPKILQLILKLRQSIRTRNAEIKSLKHRLKQEEKKNLSTQHSNKNPSVEFKSFQNLSTQTETPQLKTDISSKTVENTNNEDTKKTTAAEQTEATGWNSDKSIADQVKEAALNALDEFESKAGWNIDNSGGEKEKSIAEQVKEVAQNALQQGGMVYVESAGMYYDYKTGYYYNSELGLYYHTDTNCYYYLNEKQQFVFHSYPDTSAVNANLLAHQKKKARKQLKRERKPESDIENLTKTLSQVSLRGRNALDAIAKHLPPCMRVIVRETDLPKLKVGTLFLITKDGGTVGREGEQHTILIRDNNVSRNHLDVRYDMQRQTYVAMDLGSKNGTILNGNRMSESSEISGPMDVLHGSTIQLGGTKLLCHIHPGNDTCGHCEPGLIMESEDKEKKAAYTRTCSVKKQHELELARLKNIYAPQLLQIEEKPYNDRAQARRETVGSSHHSVKTDCADLDTSISTENKGFKLLQKMGWSEGEGLGKDCQGNTEPVPLISNDGKAGLGTSGAVSAPPLVPKPRPKNTIASATMRLAARTKMLQPPAKAFQGDEDEDFE